MKDIYGVEIKVGDTVLCSGGNYKQLLEQIVVSTTPKTCNVALATTIAEHPMDVILGDRKWMLTEKKVLGQVYVLS